MFTCHGEHTGQAQHTEGWTLQQREVEHRSEDTQCGHALGTARVRIGVVWNRGNARHALHVLLHVATGRVLAQVLNAARVEDVCAVHGSRGFVLPLMQTHLGRGEGLSTGSVVDVARCGAFAGRARTVGADQPHQLLVLRFRLLLRRQLEARVRLDNFRLLLRTCCVSVDQTRHRPVRKRVIARAFDRLKRLEVVGDWRLLERGEVDDAVDLLRVANHFVVARDERSIQRVVRLESRARLRLESFLEDVAVVDRSFRVRFVALAFWAVLLEWAEDEAARDTVKNDGGDDPVSALPAIFVQEKPRCKSRAKV